MVVPDLAQDRVAALGVQTGGGLVQHQHAGVHGHDARNRNAALLPARKLKRAFFQQLIGQADERGGLPDAALDLGLVQAHVARAVGDVAGAGLLKQLVLGVLHDKADEKAEAAQVCTLLPQVPAVHKDAARRRAVQAVEMADKRGFSAARRADDADKVALLNGEGHVIQRLRRVGHTLVIDVAQVFYTNDFGHSCSFPAGYSPVAVPFRHTWEFFVRVASPKGEAVGGSARRLMRGGFAAISHKRDTSASSPLIRPRAGPRPPSPLGEGGLYFSSLYNSSAQASGVMTFSGIGIPALTSSSRSSAACGTSR